MTTEKGVWNLQQVRDKQLQDAWKTYSGEQQLFTVGRNNFGNLGQNNRTDYSSPVQVTGTTWSEIYSGRGGGRALTLKTDGTLWTWGGTNDGASGLNSLVLYSSPVQIGSETTWGSIETYTNSSLAQKTDGTLWTWGGNERGQLGQNHTANRSSPIQIPGTWNKDECAIGGGSASGIKDDGTFWKWGRNFRGSLGLGDNTSYSSPMQVGTDKSTWLKNGGMGSYYSAAILG